MREEMNTRPHHVNRNQRLPLAFSFGDERVLNEEKHSGMYK